MSNNEDSDVSLESPTADTSLNSNVQSRTRSRGINAHDLFVQGANNRREFIENSFGRREDDIDETPERNVRVRHNTELIPLDLNLVGASMMRRTTPVLLSQLLNNNIQEIVRNGRIDLMLLRCIANGKHGQTNYMVKQYAARGGNKNNCSNSNYSRLFLFKVMNATEPNALVYMMESENQNKKLWGRNPTLRDDGTIAIGTIIRVLNPLPVESIMPDGIPSLVTRFAAVILQNPRKILHVPINDALAGNNSLAFALNNCKVSIIASTPEETGCAGCFCDKQRIHEIAQYRQGCACYVWSDRRNNMIIDHSLNIEHPSWTGYIKSFSSLRFSSLYQTSVFSTSIRRDVLELSEQYYELDDSINRVVELVNENGGFTVVGWYKRGVVNDRSVLTVLEKNTNNYNNNTSTEIQVDNGKLNFHPTSIQPTNKNFFDPEHNLFTVIKDIKFNVSNLHQMN